MAFRAMAIATLLIGCDDARQPAAPNGGTGAGLAGFVAASEIPPPPTTATAFVGGPAHNSPPGVPLNTFSVLTLIEVRATGTLQVTYLNPATPDQHTREKEAPFAVGGSVGPYGMPFIHPEHFGNTSCQFVWAVAYRDAANNVYNPYPGRYVDGKGECFNPPPGNAWVDTVIVRGVGTAYRGCAPRPGFDWFDISQSCAGTVRYSQTGGHTVTVTPLDATLALDADVSALVSEGRVTFRARAVPDIIKLTVPLQILSWTWSRGSVDCVAGENPCTIPVADTGTMTVEALVNGRYFKQSAEIQVANLKVRIRPVSGPMQAAPAGTGLLATLELEVGVYDGETPVPDRTVTLSLTPNEGTAGHLHIGGKSPGRLSRTVVPTGSGVARVRYFAPVASGPVTIRGTSEQAAEALDSIRVKVPGLVPLGAGTAYARVGSPGDHAGRYTGTPAFVAALQALASAFHQTYSPPADSLLGFNDMSLPQGGIFDLNNTWAGEHAEHRVGTNVDMRTRDRSSAQLRFLWREWERLGGSIHDETRKRRPHYHLRY